MDDISHHNRGPYVPLVIKGVRQVKGNNGQLYHLSKELLGRGSFGVVYLSVEESTGRQAAIKEIERDSNLELVYEIETLRKLQSGHPHIVQLYDVVYCEDNQRVLIIMEHLHNSLQQVLTFAGRIAMGELQTYLRQILDGLDYLHSEVRLVHRDLKPANIMLTNQKVVKIVDFGLAISPDVSTVGHKGTPFYMPPEAGMGHNVEPSWDIWSLGIIVVHLFTGRLPRAFERCTNMMMLCMVIQQATLETIIPSSYQGGEGSEGRIGRMDASLSSSSGGAVFWPSTLREFVGQCVRHEPRSRPTCKELRRHPFLQQRASIIPALPQAGQPENVLEKRAPAPPPPPPPP
eukprot:RCo027980